MEEALITKDACKQMEGAAVAMPSTKFTRQTVIMIDHAVCRRRLRDKAAKPPKTSSDIDAGSGTDSAS